ncbi:MAG: LPS-assembly protein LptD [Rhodobacteraceae bacterium]|nr:LPS-assembly protein LptD [Paracoccaceae bacterium]
MTGRLGVVSGDTSPGAKRRPWPAIAALVVIGVLFGAPSGLRAQDTAQDAAQDSVTTETLLQADEISYDDNTDTVTASGRVEIDRGGRILLADQVTYDRATDRATATGNVSVLDTNGTVLFFDSLAITGDLKEGLARDVRVLLADKSRMVGRGFSRRDGNINELFDAIYSACDICADRPPVWQIRAGKVRYDQKEEMVYYRNARVEMLGVPVFYTPYLAHPDPTAGRKSGLLLPAVGGGANLGVSYRQPYYINIAPDRDATLSPLFTTDAGSGATAEYRQVFASGDLMLFGSLVSGDAESNKDFRGHIRSSARWDIDENWRTGAELHLASDRTYLRRYGFEAPTWLTSRAFLERFTRNTYFSAEAFNFQRQRGSLGLSQTPIIAPLLQFSYVSDSMPGGSYFTADSNAVVLVRTDGSDQNRFSAAVGWHLPYTSDLGAVTTLSASMRGDAYYVRDVARPSEGDTYTGTAGRAVPRLSLEWRLPMINSSGPLTQMLEPVVMGVVSPIGQNPEKIPNEDSRDLEFDDTNLFSAQRFTGFDRVEGGARINYGLRWSLFGARSGTITTFIGQRYRFHRDDVYNPLSGLNGKFSDYVGHVDFAPNPYVYALYRFRLDKDNLAARRSELAAAVGPPIFRLGVNYLFVKQGDPSNPAIGDREELYVAASSKINQYWSLNASHREDLSPGGGRIRTALGVEYEDECFIFGIDFADDNTFDRDFKSGISVLLRFNLKTIGEINFNTNVSAAR